MLVLVRVRVRVSSFWSLPPRPRGAKLRVQLQREESSAALTRGGGGLALDKGTRMQLLPGAPLNALNKLAQLCGCPLTPGPSPPMTATADSTKNPNQPAAPPRRRQEG